MTRKSQVRDFYEGILCSITIEGEADYEGIICKETVKEKMNGILHFIYIRKLIF